MSQRTFGVEIECGNPAGYAEVARMLRGSPFPAWGNDVGSDGSGVEIRSPVLSGSEGFKQLRRIFEFLKENGTYVTTRDGMHVHHGAHEFRDDKKLAINLVKSWAAHQPIIEEFVAPYRNGNRAYNPAWSEDDVKRLEDNEHYWGDRYTLNLLPLFTNKRTIEVRQHHGTLDGDEAEAWIAFCQRFIDSAAKRKRPMVTCATKVELVRRVRTPAKQAEHLVRVRRVNPPENRPAGAPHVGPHFRDPFNAPRQENGAVVVDRFGGAGADAVPPAQLQAQRVVMAAANDNFARILREFNNQVAMPRMNELAEEVDE